MEVINVSQLEALRFVHDSQSQTSSHEVQITISPSADNPSPEGLQLVPTATAAKKKAYWKRILRKFLKKSRHDIGGGSVEEESLDETLGFLLQEGNKQTDSSKIGSTRNVWTFFGPKLLEFFIPLRIPSAADILGHIKDDMFMNDIYLQLAPLFRQDSFELSLLPSVNMMPDYKNVAISDEVVPSICQEINSVPLKCLVALEKLSVNLMPRRDVVGDQELELSFDIFCENIDFVIDVYFGLSETENDPWTQYGKKSNFSIRPDRAGKIRFNSTPHLPILKSDISLKDVVIHGVTEQNPDVVATEGAVGLITQALAALGNFFGHGSDSTEAVKSEPSPWKEQFRYEWPLVIVLSPKLTDPMDGSIESQANFFVIETSDSDTYQLHLVKQKVYLNDYSLMMSEIYFSQEVQEDQFTLGKSSGLGYQNTIKSLCESPGNIPMTSDGQSPSSNGRKSPIGFPIFGKKTKKTNSVEKTQVTSGASSDPENETGGGRSGVPKYLGFLRRSLLTEKNFNEIPAPVPIAVELEEVVIEQPSLPMQPHYEPRTQRLSECVICMSPKFEFVVMIPCKHASVCVDCALAYVQVPPLPPNPLARDLIPRYKDCPLCRHPIMSLLKIDKHFSS